MHVFALLETGQHCAHKNMETPYRSEQFGEVRHCLALEPIP